jgi:hypothetical protein
MIIYKVENKISGKVYIGQTIHTLETRKNTHLKMVEVGKSKFYIRRKRKPLPLGGGSSKGS